MSEMSWIPLAQFIILMYISRSAQVLEAAPIMPWELVSGYRRHSSCVNAIVGPSLGSVNRGWMPQQCADQCNANSDCAGFQYGHNEYKITGSVGRWCILKTQSTMAMIKANNWLCPPSDDAVYSFYLKDNTATLPQSTTAKVPPQSSLLTSAFEEAKPTTDSLRWSRFDQPASTSEETRQVVEEADANNDADRSSSIENAGELDPVDTETLEKQNPVAVDNR